MTGMSDPLDPGVPALTRSTTGRRSIRRLFAALLLASVLGPLPPIWAEAGVTEQATSAPQIDVEDGYQLAVAPSSRVVTGTGFTPNALAEIFQCEAGATVSGEDLHQECALIGEAQTDGNGSFRTTHVTNVGTDTNKVILMPDFVSPAHGLRTCRRVGATQCALAAATYGSPGSPEPTSQAERLICFRAELGRPKVADCVPEGPPPTTTTTVPTTMGEWEPSAGMNGARQRHAAAVGSDGRIYAMGGNEANGDPIDSAETFDPCGPPNWTPLPPMPTGRTEFAVAAGPDGRIYAIGGSDRLFGTPLASVDAYDPLTNTWAAVANLALPRSDLAAATGPDGRIYAIGGLAGFQPGTPVPIVEAYNLEIDAWEPVTPLSMPRAGHGAATVNGRIYAVGGRSGVGVAVPPVEYYTLGPAGTPGVWQRGASAGGAIPDHMAVTVGSDGLIYVLGGSSGNGRVTNIYDPASDTWRSSPEALTTSRAALAAVGGRDGRIYAIGGSDEFGGVGGPPPLASTESAKVGPNTCPRLTQPADFDGDYETDVSVFRPSSGTWFAKDGDTVAYGAQGDIPVPADYDGDRVTDVAIFRPSVGLWAIHRSSDDTDVFLTYGIGTDVPVPADYDGDAKADIAIFRPEFGLWWVRHSSTGLDVPTTFGIATDTPVPADYDGDARADIAVFRHGTWFTLPSSGGSYLATAYGNPGDIPVPADYDADRVMDRAVFRPTDGSWSLHRSSDNTDETFSFGNAGDVPVPGDYNGDRISDPAVFRPATGEWFIETGETHTWGFATDIPLPLPDAIRRAYFGGNP